LSDIVRFFRGWKLSFSALLAIYPFALLLNGAESGKTACESDFNFGWKFKLSDVDAAADPDFNDSDWQTVNLPHDWSVAFGFDEALDGATAYLPGGVGWYRKTFTLKLGRDQDVCILFDGIYNHSEVFLNGHKLGYRPNGYVPIEYQITDYLKQGANVIAVKVDRSRYIDSRWYSGAGIYRNVTLKVKNKVSMSLWDTLITTPEVGKDKSKVLLQTIVRNRMPDPQIVDVKVEVINPCGKTVAVSRRKVRIAGDRETKLNESYEIVNPALWSIEEPNTYALQIEVFKDEELIGETVVSFGIRSIRFDADDGFFLNDINLKIKGVCLHQDGGLVGVAVPKDVWRRRLKTLKEGGCNAIRMAHNPASEELLELCDEMGFLVQEEFFDEWDYPKDKRLNQWERHEDYVSRGYAESFQEWAETDLKATIRAHRNHPSIFQWSIGNEIEWTYPRNREATGYFNNMGWKGNYFWTPPPYGPEKIRSEYQRLPVLQYQIETTASKLSKWTREVDITRPVIANCILPSASFESGYADALDIVGFSYRRVMYDYAKTHYPNKVIMGTENLPQWHEWKAVLERPFVAGTFLWTGIDYMGESHGAWPMKAYESGLLDLAGFEKPSFHMFKTLWCDDPHVFICTQTEADSIYRVDDNGDIVEKEPGSWKERTWLWHDVNEHWNYPPESMTIVEVYSNCSEVELFLNDRSLGVKHLEDFEDHIMRWNVVWEPGKLRAEGRGNPRQRSATWELKTHGEPYGIRLSTDREHLEANGYDVVHVVAQLVDKEGLSVINEQRKISFQIQGPVTLLGVDNGVGDNLNPFQSNSIVSHKGRCLMILKSDSNVGDVFICAESNGLHGDTLQFQTFKSLKLEDTGS